MALTKFKAPQLPRPYRDADTSYIASLLSVLELYFSKLDSTTPNYSESYAADKFYPGTSNGSTAGPFFSSGAGTPEGVVTAPVGSIWTRTDGGATTTLYIKTSGTGNTGWTAK